MEQLIGFADLQMISENIIQGIRRPMGINSRQSFLQMEQCSRWQAPQWRHMEIGMSLWTVGLRLRLWQSGEMNRWTGTEGFSYIEILPTVARGQ